MKSNWMACIILLLAAVKTQVTSDTSMVSYELSSDEYTDIYTDDYGEDDNSSNKTSYCPTLRVHVYYTTTTNIIYSNHLICSSITSDNVAAVIEELHSQSRSSLHLDMLTISNSHLRKITNGMFLKANGLKKLLFENTTIEAIAPSAFMGLASLTTLSLNKTNIQSLSDGSFNGLTSLNELILTKNNFNDKLNGKIFSNLSKLTILNLDDNFITKINPTTFQGMHNLKHLSMRQNLLKKLDRNMLQISHYVSHFIISDNTITKIEDNTFCSELEVLDISFNYLTLLRAEIFGNLSKNMKLTNLNLSYNKLKFNKTFLSHFPNLKNISLNHNAVEEFSDLKIWSNIDLSFNKIRKISNVTFVLGAEHFDISHNSLTRFEKLGGVHLLKLYMNHNNLSGQIKFGDFNEFPKLTILRLDFNNITSFSNGSFDGLENLQILNISFNSLNDLNPIIFHPLKSLKVLLIDGNHLKTLDLHLMEMYLPSLKRIGLSHNHWSCDELSSMLFLEYMQPTDIQIDHHSIHRTSLGHVLHCFNDKPSKNTDQNEGKQKLITEESTLSTSTEKEAIEDKPSRRVDEDSGLKQKKQNDLIPLNESNTGHGKPSESISGLKITIIVLSTVAGYCGLSYILYFYYRKKCRSQSNINAQNYQAMEAEELL